MLRLIAFPSGLYELELTTTVGRLARCTFMAVVWEIWCSRNKARFEGQGMSAKHISNRSTLSIRVINTSFKVQKMPLSWLSALRQFRCGNENLKLDGLPPSPGRLKLNVDGAFKMTLGDAGEGGILRDHKGNMCCAFAKAYHRLKSSLAIEALALRDGLSICCNKRILEVMVETDSLNLLQIITR
ncbi:hypothetical protein Taro_017953 [Colocasia esculenta]|uniref:RNase H type-1 domain-containing protein n=1 Tax=Colocasia esculenta TaxID=4460 RepID=A0A843V0Z5_COLES|nr:hypothetical protein [Colocasia esculenta]